MTDQIAELQARIKQLEGQLPDTEFEGIARCLVCGEDRPMPMRRETVETRAPDMNNLVLATTIHVVPLVPVDCPGCGQPRALLEHQPPTYARIAAA